MQVRLFYGLQVIEINQLIHCISYKVYYVNFRNTYKNSKAEKIYPSMIQKKYVKSNMMAEGVGSLVSS